MGGQLGTGMVDGWDGAGGDKDTNAHADAATLRTGKSLKTSGPARREVKLRQAGTPTSSQRASSYHFQEVPDTSVCFPNRHQISHPMSALCACEPAECVWRVVAPSFPVHDGHAYPFPRFT